MELNNINDLDFEEAQALYEVMIYLINGIERKSFNGEI